MLPFLFGVPTYALCVLLGVLAALLIFFILLPANRRKPTVPIVLYAALGALVGAKALYLLTNPAGLSNLQSFLTGFVFHGGLIGGAAAGLYAAHLQKQPILSLADAAAPCLAIGHGIGRVGCFLAGCCYGLPAPPPFGLIMPNALGAPHNIPLLPVPLIEAVLNIALGLLLLRRSHTACEPGRTAGYYCLSYAVIRFMLEFLRGDSVRGFAGGLSTGQWMSLALFLLGFVLEIRTSHILLTLHDASLLIDNRLLGGLMRIRFTAKVVRDASGKAALHCTLWDRPITLRRSRRTQFNFLDALNHLPLHVRRLHVHVVLGIAQDAASTALLCGVLSSALDALASLWISREEIPPDVRIRVLPDYRTPQLHADLSLLLSFRTFDAIRAIRFAFKRDKSHSIAA